MLRQEATFHNLLGFTKEEILFYFAKEIQEICIAQNKTEKQLMQELELKYNGYKYHENAQNTLFNAFEIQN